METVRLLVISHNAFGMRNNMGKTLDALFSTWPSDKIAQLYLSDKLPESTFCKRYYRLTDFDVAKTLLGKQDCGGPVEVGDDTEQPKMSALRQATINQGKKRTPMVYFLRNFMWEIGSWKSKALQEWLDEFKPQAVFFASGDYYFSYKIALEICKERQIHLYLYCCDDFYLGGYTAQGWLGQYNYRKLMRIVHQSFDYARDYFCICEEMEKDYAQLFGKRGKVVQTAATLLCEQCRPVNQRIPQIVYAGNIDCGRAEQLVRIGRILKQQNMAISTIHVFSPETREDLIRLMKQSNGIEFHGCISAEDVERLIEASMFILHVESFDSKVIARIKYSVSTKIANGLASGSCILAVGPSQVASIRYLLQNQAAYVIDETCDLEKSLTAIMENEVLREEIVCHALHLAQKNHNRDKNQHIIYDAINRVTYTI